MIGRWSSSGSSTVPLLDNRRIGVPRKSSKKVDGMATEPIYERLGHRLQGLRVVNGITQEEMAVRVGLVRTSIANIEAGRQRILLHQLYDFAAALKVRPDRLLIDINVR